MATFTSSATGVHLAMTINNCQNGKTYPIHIHMGTSCSAPGDHWDMRAMGLARGEGITYIPCAGTTGMQMYDRANTSTTDLPWSIGGDPMSNILGHPVVVHDPDTSAEISCGVIQLAP